jgi:hypothetical protein
MTAASEKQRVINLAFTGASGAQYGLRLLQCLVAANCRVHVMPGQFFAEGAMAPVYWGMVDLGRPLGDYGDTLGMIPQVNETYSYFQPLTIAKHLLPHRSPQIQIGQQQEYDKYKLPAIPRHTVMQQQV